MGKAQSLLSGVKDVEEAAAASNKAMHALHDAEEVAKIKPEPRQTAERARQLFQIIVASAAEKAKLAAQFFNNLEQRLGKLAVGLTHNSFGFEDPQEFAKYLKALLVSASTSADNVKEFQEGMKGRKWRILGHLWERYIKYGPFRQYLDATALEAWSEINGEIAKGSFQMVDARGTRQAVKGHFGPLLAGVEYILETDKGEKAYLDFGHIAFNEQGYGMLPTPTEIKLPAAYRGVAKQFGEFIPRLQDAKKLIVVFEEKDLAQIAKLQSSGTGILSFKVVDGMIHAVVDHEKLVFNPLAKNQIVVKPLSNEWFTVKAASGSPETEIDLRVKSNDPKITPFFFWIMDVAVSRAPFEKIYEAVFLGK